MTLAIVIVIAVAVLLIAGGVCRHQHLLKDRALLMRDAIRHRDFSFRLPTKGLLPGERALQETLNAMGDEIQKLVAHNEVESWQRLTRVLTHEIMNASTPIQSITQAYLSNQNIKGTPYEEGIQAIHDTSTGLATFVDSYRKLTQLQEPVLCKINLTEFIGNLRALYPDIQWDIDVPARLVMNADESLLRQAFINIVKNAIEASAKKIGIRHISHPQAAGKDTSTFHKLQISNDGHTIPDEVAHEIFIPFFTTKHTGSGIGLAVSRQILMMQKYTLTLREHPIYGYNVTFEMESDG